MYKIFLLTIMFLILGNSGHCYSIYYSNTGVPVRVQTGSGQILPYRQAMNLELERIRNSSVYPQVARPYCPRRRLYYGRNRIMPQTSYVTDNVKPVSRFDRNYKPKMESSYTENGVTYYE